MFLIPPLTAPSTTSSLPTAAAAHRNTIGTGLSAHWHSSKTLGWRLAWCTSMTWTRGAAPFVAHNRLDCIWQHRKPEALAHLVLRRPFALKVSNKAVVSSWERGSFEKLAASILHSKARSRAIGLLILLEGLHDHHITIDVVVSEAVGGVVLKSVVPLDVCGWECGWEFGVCSKHPVEVARKVKIGEQLHSHELVIHEVGIV